MNKTLSLYSTTYYLYPYNPPLHEFPTDVFAYTLILRKQSTILSTTLVTSERKMKKISVMHLISPSKKITFLNVPPSTQDTLIENILTQKVGLKLCFIMDGLGSNYRYSPTQCLKPTSVVIYITATLMTTSTYPTQLLSIIIVYLSVLIKTPHVSYVKSRVRSQKTAS